MIEETMVQIHPELTLDLNPTHIPKPITAFLDELTAIGDVSERVSKLDDFIKRIEDELRKIEAFKRELPICMLLLSDAIVNMKEISTLCRKRNVEPILEEFIPIKKRCDEDEKTDVRKENDNRDKKNWMSSVQLWNCDSNTDLCDGKQKPKNKQRTEEGNSKVIYDPFQASKSKSARRSFMPFHGHSNFPMSATGKEDKIEFPVGGLSLATPGFKNPKEELGSTGLSSKTSGSKTNASSAPNVQPSLRNEPQTPQQQTARKQRRCWSPELHRRFINALQQLGGSQAATPKQIRELMQVDGLTNDEVKSHLQKYRLHTRRVPGSAKALANQSMVVLGELWGPQDECGESSKTSNSQSGSPQGPLQSTCGGTSTTGGDFNEEEDDDKSESYSWKSHHVHKSGKDNHHV